MKTLRQLLFGLVGHDSSGKANRPRAAGRRLQPFAEPMEPRAMLSLAGSPVAMTASPVIVGHATPGFEVAKASSGLAVTMDDTTDSGDTTDSTDSGSGSSSTTPPPTPVEVNGQVEVQPDDDVCRLLPL